jgi:hypothetical protein
VCRIGVLLKLLAENWTLAGRLTSPLLRRLEASVLFVPNQNADFFIAKRDYCSVG